MREEDPLFKWSWPARPANETDFDKMMTSLDRHLASLALEPFQRDLNAALVVSSTLGLSGTPILGGPADRGPPFSPRDLLARVHDWYVENYGDRMKMDMSPGTTLVLLHSNLWKFKMPRLWGSMQVFADRNLTNEGRSLATKRSEPASHNVLRSLEGMTQAYANKLTDAELATLHRSFIASFQAMRCLDDLKGHQLFEEAKADYRHSVAALFSGNELGKARWETAQCAEKVLKGLLARDAHAFPTDGARGHDTVHLGGLVKDKLGITLSVQLLTTIKCTAAVRYGEVPSTREEALAAHDALIRVLLLLAAAKAHYWQPPP